MDDIVNSEVLAKLIRRQYRTQSAFAEAVGVSRQYISQIIKGERTPSLRTTAVFAEKLGVSVNDLLGKALPLVRVAA